jgi:Domain of unknown function (DUF4893)
MRRAFLLSIAIAVCGCSTLEQPTRMMAQSSRDWRQVATSADRERLREWRGAFVDAIAAARNAGHAADLAREGALLEPDAALGGGPIPNGLYQCRVIKVGAKSQGLLGYVAYPAFRCRISADGSLQSFAKLSGSQRHVGVIFPGDALRQVFLGTLARGDEQGAMQYGVDEMRNVAGYIERIGPNRWRLVMPRPHFESQLDVMELVPA